MHAPPAAPHAAPGTPADGIPRLIYLARILNLCFFPLTTVILGNIALLSVPQAKEALFAFDDDNAHILTLKVSFEIAYILWMIAAWYVARLLLGKRFQPDLIGVCDSPTFAKAVATHLPRFLALVAGLPLAFFLFRRQPTLGVASICASVLVFVCLVYRRKWGEQHQWRKNWKAHGAEVIERFDNLSHSGWAFILALFALSFGLWLVLPFAMQSFARPVGAPALLLLALMSWTLFGGFILTYLPKSYHTPAFTWIAALAIPLFYLCNENHPVARPQPEVRNGDRLPVETAFADWLQHRSNPKAPVIFVASAGGASRAAYWTTSSLGLLEDEARQQQVAFADNIFVISGISGGSLGAATFVTSLDLVRREPVSICQSVRNVGNGFTGRDHLSTVVGLMLFPDFIQRFLPFSLNAWDRSRGLEEVWASDWHEVLDQCQPTVASSAGPNPWSGAFTAVPHGPGQGGSLPYLVLDSTAINAGQAVLQANFTLERADVFDLLDQHLQTGSLTLAQAVHNSARFPYISPAGVVRKIPDGAASGNPGAKRGPVWDRLGDGGYVEASGALPLTQILKELQDHQLIREGDSPGDCSNPNDRTACYIGRGQIRVLLLDNTPIEGPALLCAPAASGTRAAQAQNGISKANKFIPPGPDFLAPLLGAFSTRGGRGLSAQVDLRAWVDGCTGHFAELRLPMPADANQQPSMDWILNRTSRQVIDRALDRLPSTLDQPLVYLDNPLNALQQNLQIVRSWFAPRAGS